MQLFNDTTRLMIKSAAWSATAALSLLVIPLMSIVWGLQPKVRPKPPRPSAAMLSEIDREAVAKLDRDTDRGQQRKVNGFDAGADRSRKHADLIRWGRPDSNYLSSDGGEFLIGRPDRTRCPRWVLERLDQDSLAGSADRDDDRWNADDRVPVEFRAKNADYRGSNFDRGHLAASGNHVSSEKAQAATFVLSNAMPQTAVLNQVILNRLENQIRLRVKKGEVCWVLTLPVWKRDEQRNICTTTIGDGIWVPTHVAKACLWSPDKRRAYDVQTLSLECFEIPNDEKFPENATPQDYRVSGDGLEADAGLDLFANLPDDVENKLESEK